MIDQVLCSDAIDFMASLDACSIDSIVTDPPHNLVFLGEDWDRKGEPQEYQDWCREWGEEAKRILKPGGYLLAAAATRTHHRLTSGLEDAGFSIRDCLLYLFGNGFPKNYDISKGFDRQALQAWLNSLPQDELGGFLVEVQRAYTLNTGRDDEKESSEGMAAPSTGSGQRLLRVAVSAAITGLASYSNKPKLQRRGSTRCLGGYDDPGRRNTIREGVYLLERLIERFWKPLPEERRHEIWQNIVGDHQDCQVCLPPGVRIRGIGKWKMENGKWKMENEKWKMENGFHSPLSPFHSPQSVTAPSTPLARKWEDWGTALKPGWMPIVVAQKPCEGTFCHNVEKWGAGVLNIEACRIALPPHTPDEKTETPGDRAAEGRWPANVCLDEEAARQLDRQTGVLTSGKGPVRRCASSKSWSGSWRGTESQEVYGDSGGASRFFYCARASKDERTMQGRVNNPHKTVKPLELVRWLVRLVTPPRGIVLDPFCGSGTTLMAAKEEGFRFLGCDAEPQYVEIARHRLRLTMRKPAQLALW